MKKQYQNHEHAMANLTLITYIHINIKMSEVHYATLKVNCIL